MKIITQATNLKNKRVLVRADIDVLLDGKIDTFRLDAGLATLKFLLEQEALPTICGHMGKPTEFTEALSTKQLTPYYDQNLGNGRYKLLENTKFNPGEATEDMAFAKFLAEDMDIYVNDSFATSHRNYASITGVPKLLESYAGIRLNEEINMLDNILESPNRPLVAIIGGAKLESKLPTVQSFLKIADEVLLGGKLGLEWKDEIPNHLHLPVDYATDNLDIGSQTIKNFLNVLQTAKTVIWAGPLGYYEKEEYITGTNELATFLANSEIYSLVGGGDTISAIKKTGNLEGISYVSTGGGAMLTYITERTLPGIKALS